MQMATKKRKFRDWVGQRIGGTFPLRPFHDDCDFSESAAP